MTNQQNGSNDDFLWRHLKSVPAFRGLLRAVEARFYQKVELPSPTLDVGCGDGHFAQMTFARPLDIGTDPWWGPLNKSQNAGIYHHVLQGRGDWQPFPDHTFASAVSNSVLEHIPDIQAVLNETSRVLKPNSPFVMTMPSHLFTEYLGGAEFLEKIKLNSVADVYRDFFNFISRHAHTDSPEVWAERLAKAGFAIERWQYYFSREALHALEWGHVQGLPSAVMHFLTGHWIVAPWESSLQRTEQWLRPFYNEPFTGEGAYIFIVARKVADGPIRATLPDERPYTLAELEEGEVTESGEWEVEPPTDWVVESVEIMEEGEAVGEATAVIAATTDTESPAPHPASSTPRPTIQLNQIPRQRWLYLVALIFAFFAQSLGNSQRGGLAILTWLVATATATFALWQNHQITDTDSTHAPHPTPFSLRNLAIPLILFIAAYAVRAYNLIGHPFILNGTEASIGQDILRVIDGSANNPFATGWLTNPTWPNYILAIPVRLFGATTLGLRMLSPIVGALTVVMVYWFGKRLWNREVGLVAAVLLAGSHFHLQYSRLGVTNIWDPLLVLLALGFLALAWRDDSQRLWWLLAGLSIGFSAYFFTSARLLPLMLLPLLAIAFVFDWQKLTANWPHLFATIALAFVVALPQLIYYNSHRDVFMDRANNLGIMDNRSGWLSREVGFTGKSRSQIWSEQIRRGLLSFNSGLDNSPSYKPEAPLLSLGPSLLFLLGMGVAIWQWRQWPNRMLIVWVLITLIFAAVLLENPPNSHRLIIAAPALSLLAAVALVHFGQLIVGERGQMVTTVMLVVAVALAGLDVAFYYGRYQSQHSFGDRNTEVADDMGEYLSSLEGDWTAYFFGPPSMYVGFPTIPFLANNFQENINLFDVLQPDATLPLPSTPNQVYIFLPERFGEMQAIANQFPGGELRTFAGFHADPLFYAYEVGAVPD